MKKDFQIWKKTTINGCVYEDESDTRTFETEFLIVPKEQEEDFVESVADDCGYQDYSYKVKYELVFELFYYELTLMINLFKEIKNKIKGN